MLLKRNSKVDWERILELAKAGKHEEIPADILIRCYNQICRIGKDHLQPIAVERRCKVFWGDSNTGKTRRAWEEAGMEAFPKDPNTKWWCGYRDQENVIIDEFDGQIAFNHLSRWIDRYPCNLESKHGAVSNRFKKIWITSNVDPRKWYPNNNEQQQVGLLRRLDIYHYQKGIAGVTINGCPEFGTVDTRELLSRSLQLTDFFEMNLLDDLE